MSQSQHVFYNKTIFGKNQQKKSMKHIIGKNFIKIKTEQKLTIFGKNQKHNIRNESYQKALHIFTIRK